MAGQPLAVGAEMGGSGGEDDALDGRVAFSAGLVVAGVDVVEVLEASWGAVGIDIVAEGAAAGVYGAAEDELDGLGELADLCVGEVVGGGEGVDGGDEERFIGVDVAEAGDEGLVEECGLDRAAGAGEELVELVWVEGEGFGAEVGFGVGGGGEERDGAEAAGVAEAEMEVGRGGR